MRRRRSAGHVNGNLFDLVAANASPLADRLSARLTDQHRRGHTSPPTHQGVASILGDRTRYFRKARNSQAKLTGRERFLDRANQPRGAHQGTEAARKGLPHTTRITSDAPFPERSWLYERRGCHGWRRCGVAFTVERRERERLRKCRQVTQVDFSQQVPIGVNRCGD